MTLEVLKLIIMMCSISSLEDTKGSWTELHKLEKYQKDCRVWYMDCYGRQKDEYAEIKIMKCIRERSPSE